MTVESSPKYVFNPLAPYRMGMVQPYARLVLLLRDPTDRCDEFVNRNNTG